jgi:hypothetical protein
MCTSSLSAGPPIMLPHGQALIPAKPNPQPGNAAQIQPPATPHAVPSDPNRGKTLDIAV